MSRKGSNKKARPKAKSKSRADQKSGISPVEVRSFQDRFPFFAKYWEPLIFLVYASALCAVVLPGLRYGYDIGHDAALLISSVRIRAGQVPFRDFYPWYGPLYHYFVTLVWAMVEKDLYGIKFFVDIISPILSMGILILTLRNLDLARSSKLFVLIAAPILGLERIYYCGSLRNFLPVFFISLWYRADQKRQKIIYFSIFPAGLLLWFFSPEVGIYTLLTGVVFIVLGLWKRSWEERMELLAWSGAGLVLTGLTFAILYRSTGWLRNYLEYVSVLSNNLAWSHGSSVQSALPKIAAPIYYLQPVIHLLALGILFGQWRRNKKLPEHWLLILVLTALGLLLYNRTLIKAHPSHVQFAFLPALIILSLAWAPPWKPIRGWKLTAQILEILMILYGGIFFKQQILPEFRGKEYQTVMGVRINPEDGKCFQAVKRFYELERSSGEFVFPLKSLDYAYLGLVPDLPFDDLHYIFYPRYRKMFLEALEKKQAKYLIIDEKDMFWDYPGENTDALIDYLDSNYQEIKLDRPVWIYQRRPRPVETTGLIKLEPNTMVLSPENDFQLSLQAPAGIKADRLAYLEFSSEFQYSFPFLERLSMPIVKCGFNGKEWVFKRPEYGRQRINPMPGKHRFRVYLLYPFQELTVQLTFPGILNPAPSRVKIEDLQWRQGIVPNLTPRTASYFFVKEPEK